MFEALVVVCYGSKPVIDKWPFSTQSGQRKIS